MNIAEQSNAGPMKQSLTPVLAAAWGCVAVLAVWGLHLRLGDAAMVLIAAAAWIVSLVVSRYVFNLAFASAPMFYLVLLGLFHLGLVVPLTLGLYDISKAPWFFPHGLARALTLFVYAILAFQAGLYAASAACGPARNSAPEGAQQLENTQVFAIGLLLLTAALWMFAVGLIGLDPISYFRINYSEIFRLEAETDPRFFGSGITVGFIGSCLVMGGASRRQLVFGFAAVGVWVSILFYFGFRGPALIDGLMVYALALKKNVSFPNWFPWAAVAFLLVAIPMEATIREQPLNERSVSNIEAVDILDGPAEMGSSIRPLIETLDLVGPGNYRLGKTYLEGVKGIVPNLALRWEPSSTESLDDLPPSHWITAIVDPWLYKNYGGLGFSAIAEPYMNFGPLGVVVFFAGLAFLLVWLERVSFHSAYSLAAWALVVGSLLWTIRNDFSSFFRPAVWGVLCLAAIRLFSGTSSRRPAGHLASSSPPASS